MMRDIAPILNSSVAAAPVASCDANILRCPCDVVASHIHMAGPQKGTASLLL